MCCGTAETLGCCRCQRFQSSRVVSGDGGSTSTSTSSSSSSSVPAIAPVLSGAQDETTTTTPGSLAKSIPSMFAVAAGAGWGSSRVVTKVVWVRTSLWTVGRKTNK